MAKFVCKVCGYVYEGDVPPTECPVCHTGAENFEEVKGEMKLAAELSKGSGRKGVFGIDGKKVSFLIKGIAV